MTHVMVGDATGSIGSHLLGSSPTAAQAVRLLRATTSPPRRGRCVLECTVPPGFSTRGGTWFFLG
jgi:hypothetical protein